MQQPILDFETKIFAKETRRTIDRALAGFRYLKDESDLELAFSLLDAHRIKTSHLYDKLSSLSNSRTRLLPHQIEATHIVANALKPRFILADEVGLGKTIEAGLIIKELAFRRGFQNILVVCPAPLGVQWQQEMRNKFNDEFEILNRKNFYKMAANWQNHKRLITSIDFIKNPKYGEDMLKRKWDIVVFDEAHRLRRDYNKVTKAYNFAEHIAERTEAMLLLTATPFRGKLEELFYLIRLVDPDLLGPHSSFVQEYVLTERSESSMLNLKNKIGRVMLRRRKVEIGGFTKRFAMTMRFDLSETERLLYDETTDYIKREYNAALAQKNRAVGFIMIAFQKLLDSSTAALLRSLERRKTKLEQQMFGPSAIAGSSLLDEFTDEEMAELFDDEEPEDNADSFEEEQKRTLKELRKEILTLNGLIKVARNIPEDRKLQKFRETLFHLRKEGYDKFVVFTQFRTTQDYLYDNLPEFKVVSFHGSLNMVQKEEAIEAFRNDIEIIICTEAGGEGRNLQFASVLFNYDLPWSPLKLEQRIGRIHRFGQKKDVKIFNFATKDTVAERVLEVLTDKIKLFEQSIGDSDPLLGDMEDEYDFQSTLMSFVAGKKTEEDFNNELESKMKIAQSGYKKLNELLTPQCIDFNFTDYYDHTREGRDIENDKLEYLTQGYLSLSPETEFVLEKRADSDKEEPVSDYRVRKTGDPKGRPATFRTDLALSSDKIDFLAVGHPLVDEALDYFLNFKEKYTVQPLPRLAGLEPGYYFISICNFVNGMSRSEMISCLIPDNPLQKPLVPEKILIPSGYHPQHFKKTEKSRISKYFQSELPDLESIEPIAQKALKQMRVESEARALQLREELHSIFKKEEYKLEISYGKKIRNLRERLDRQKLRYRTNPKAEFQAAVTRTENELVKAEHGKQLAMNKIRGSAQIEVRLKLLQIYRVL